MKLGYNVDARKRAVNLTLNEDLLAHVREVTENLSSVVESLLAEYLDKERQRRAARAKIVESTVALSLVNKSSLGKITHPRFNPTFRIKGQWVACIRSKSFLSPRRISESWLDR